MRRREEPGKKRKRKDIITGIFFGVLILLVAPVIHAPELLTEWASPGTILFFVQLAIALAAIILAAIVFITILGSRKHYKNKRAELEKSKREKTNEISDHTK